MKKNVLILVVFGLALLTGCAKKTTTTTNNNNFGGTWTFKSKTYHPNSSSRTESIIVVKDSFNTNATDYGSIYCIFPYGLPITAGTYTVVPDGQVQTANQISFMLGVDQDPLDAYYSTGRNGTETVTVSVANGKVSIVGSGVELYADRDSSSLSLDLHQLN